MTTMTFDDDEPFIPAEDTRTGRAQRFVNMLAANPGEWHRYPHPIAAPATARAKYAQRFPEVQWKLDDQGRLGGRWIGFP